MRAAVSPPRPFAVLFRHFLRQLASFETLSAGSELRQVVIAILSLLAAPGYYVSVRAVIGFFAGGVPNDGGRPALLVLWGEEWLIFTVSLCATAVLVALQWPSFVLDGRDHGILGALPVRRRTVLLARLASVLVAVLALHAGVNALGATALPIASPAGYWRTTLTLHAALLAQTAFVSAGVVAVLGLARLLLPGPGGQRLNVVLQSAVLLGACILAVTQDELGRVALAARDTPHLVNRLVPVAWFMGAYKRMLGVDAAQVVANARLALVATVGAGLLAVPCCLLGYRGGGRRPRSRCLSAPRWWPWDTLPGRPVARAVCAFVSRTAVRSENAALAIRGWLVLGVAVSLAGFGGALVRGRDLVGPPQAATLCPSIVLCFFGLVGLRLAAAYPCHLKANWVFRLSEAPSAADHAAGVRAAGIRVIVLPVLGVLFVPGVALWGPGPALAHAAFALALALFTLEWLFFGFRKVPFTCTYRPGKARLRATWPRHAATGLAYCGLIPAVESWALGRPLVLAGLVLLLLGAWQLLVHVHDAALRRSGALVFDEEAPSLVTSLGLSA